MNRIRVFSAAFASLAIVSGAAESPGGNQPSTILLRQAIVVDDLEASRRVLSGCPWV